MFVLKRIPLPPSSNQLYSSVRGRLIKSIEGRKYYAAISMYAVRNFKIIDQIKSHFSPKDTLKIDCYFVFHKSRIVSKKGEIKVLDASNRIKSCHDGISELIGIDDKHFVSGHLEKVICEKESDEQVIVHITKAKIRTYEDICNLESP